jgi:hypothetical protein
MSISTSLVIILAVPALLAACNGPSIDASGTVEGEPRQVSSFNRIEAAMGIVAEVAIEPGEAPAVTVYYDDNLLGNVETSVSGQTLVVKLDAQVNFVGDGEERRVEVTTDELLSLDVSGGSVVTATGLNGDLTLDASGGSAVTLIGESERLVINASGGSVVTSIGFTTRDIEVEASGGTVATIFASGTVTGSASGGSVVTILGGATVDVETSGGSIVE